jgi:DNA polymerase V
LRQLYQEGYQYHRAGVFLQELVPDSHRQLHLFAPNEGFTQQQAIGELVDRINQRFGHETIWYAAAGRTPGWKMRQEHRSPRYTTRIDELPLVT